MNSQEIQKRQNDPTFLKIQYAARVCFNAAERYNYLTWFACIISALSIFFPTSWNIFVLHGIPFTLDIAAAAFYKSTQANVHWGARLRNYFDANVIGINPKQFSQTEEQQIIEKAETIFSKHSHDGHIQIRNTAHDIPPGVKDWYEFSKPLNAVNAQFECQKQNIWWDQELSKYKIFTILLATVCIIATFGFFICILNRNLLNTIFCSVGIIFKMFERLRENIKYVQISQQIDGSKKTIESKPEKKHIEYLQSLINERRNIIVLKSNFIHKKMATKLSTLYNKFS